MLFKNSFLKFHKTVACNNILSIKEVHDTVTTDLHSKWGCFITVDFIKHCD